MLSDLLYRLRALLGRHQVEGEMEAEPRFPIAARRDVWEGRAGSRGGGTACAFSKFWRRDVRVALRTLQNNAMFRVVATVRLALGIGSSTAIFSVTEAVMLRPLPYGDPGRLVRFADSMTYADFEP